MSLAGDFYSVEFDYLEIRLFKCRQDVNASCQDNATVDAFFNPLELSMAYVNSYFDFSDFINPIKYFIDDNLFFTLESARVKFANMYIMKGETNLEDDLFQLQSNPLGVFPTVVDIDKYDDTYDDTNGCIAEMYVRFDPKYNMYKRQIYSITDVLKDVGGL